ncbi:MAG: vanadium-dependent haloperoxidase, partial [Burkholderiales bacterium]|nr:vanadium-dependent haloperoxidase [Burkholderiales bacterium]
STDASNPIGVGNVAAKALLDLRQNDGANQLGNLAPGAYADYTGYVPVNTPDVVTDPSKWQQLRFANGASPSYIGAHWGRVLPFALASGSQLRPPAPPVYGTPSYLTEVQGVVDALANLTEQQKVIAEYWADGPASVLPPGHWMLFAQIVAKRDQNSLDADVKLFFLMGNAMLDAAIATWEAKRFYNTSRPFTAIRALYAGKQIASFAGPNEGIKMTDGAQWYPYQSRNFITPPFAEYTSGHSAFSAAGAEILKRFTGSDKFGHSQTFAVGWSSFEANLPKSPLTLAWPTFTDAALEAGVSRIYGGIHFASANQAGQDLGRNVAEAVWNKGQSLFQN